MRAIRAAVGVTVLLATAALAGGQTDSTPRWVTLEPVSCRSDGGASLSFARDGSIHVSENNPLRDAHAVICANRLRGISGFRLEALPDPRLPSRGPGRAHNGNFVLSQLTVEERRSSGKWRYVTIVRAGATFEQPGYLAYYAFDKNQYTGWAINGGTGKRQVLCLKTDAPLGPCSKLRFWLTFNYGDRHVLGHYRLSATTDPDPLAAVNDPLGRGWPATQARVNQAIDRAVTALIRTQELDGSWRDYQDSYPTGATALCLFTLLKCGLAAESPVIRAGFRFLEDKMPVTTYSAACQILALCARADPRWERRLGRLVEQLVAWQREGGWGYPHGLIDLSNTQLAALALRTAANRGFKVPARVWERLAKRTLSHQEDRDSPYRSAGFLYRKQGCTASGSMTAAGVANLAICAEQVAALRPVVASARRKGLAWLAQNFSVTGNPWAGDIQLHYYLYGLERVGALLGSERIGPFGWYRLGARHLVETQWGDGTWDNDQADTCFALLFLRRATWQATGARAVKTYSADEQDSPVALRALGDTPLTLWLAPFPRSTRRKHAWPGEEDKGLRVREVEYLACPVDVPEEIRCIARVTGDPSRPSSDDRYRTDHTFTRSGEYVIVAWVRLAGPTPGSTTRIASTGIRVSIARASDPRVVDYAADPKRNVLAGKEVKVAASSELNGSWAARFAADNRHGPAWLSRDDDLAPDITLTVPEGVHADTLLLTHTHNTRDVERTARIREVELTINRGKPTRLRMVPDDRVKTVFEFGKVRSVRKLRLRVLEVTRAVGGKGAVGFAEIELQLRRRSHRRAREE